MGRVPPFRQLYQETISDLQMELKAVLVDLGHKSAFDLLLKEAWNPEVAAMGISTLPTVLDKLNVMSTIHLSKLIATLVRYAAIQPTGIWIGTSHHEYIPASS